MDTQAFQQFCANPQFFFPKFFPQGILLLLFLTITLSINLVIPVLPHMPGNTAGFGLAPVTTIGTFFPGVNFC